MGALDAVLAKIGATPNPGHLLAQGANKILDTSYPVDAGLARWIAGAPAFQPTLGGMLQKTGMNLGNAGAGFVQKILANDIEGAMNDSLFPMGGMTVYHGSPHKFDAFDLSKIGTGEGAQAYGHGLYFAENQGVAKGYQTKLSQPDFLTLEGLPGDLAEQAQANYMDLLREYNAGQMSYPPTARDALERVMRDLDGKAKLAAQRGDFDAYSQAQDLRTQVWRVKDAVPKEQKGALYHVDIPDSEISKMLDWDAPLSQQPEGVRKALRAIGVDIPSDEVVSAAKEGYDAAFRDYVESMKASPDGRPAEWARKAFDRAQSDLDAIHAQTKWTGQDAYRSFSSDQRASEILRQSGIPGIRYLDGGSRGAGEGTRNIVLFDDKLAKILKRE